MNLRLYSIAKEKQDRNANSRDLESVTEADKVEGCCCPWKDAATHGRMLLTGSLFLLSPLALLQHARPLSQGWPPKWDRASLTNHQSRKCTTGLPTGHSGGSIFSIEVPSSKTPYLVSSKYKSSRHRCLLSNVFFQDYCPRIRTCGWFSIFLCQYNIAIVNMAL